MTCVMFGGSRHISTLNDEVRTRVDRIVQQGFQVVVGDANGADTAFQRELADRAYHSVEVFCSGASPRNNLGSWACRHITTEVKPGTFEFHAAKDQAMAKEATVGFMLWDGESVGTVLNVWRLMQQRKTSLVYVPTRKAFFEIRAPEGWRQLLGLAADDVRADIERRIRAESSAAPENELPLFGQRFYDLDFMIGSMTVGEAKRMDGEIAAQRRVDSKVGK